MARGLKSNQHIFILLDSIDQLTPADDAYSLNWLPTVSFADSLQEEINSLFNELIDDNADCCVQSSVSFHNSSMSDFFAAITIEHAHADIHITKTPQHIGQC